jgi:hypothetical protein
VRDGGNVAAEDHAPYAQEPAARLGRVAVLGDFNRPVPSPIAMPASDSA